MRLARRLLDWGAQLPPRHLIVGALGTAYLVVCLAGGGYSVEFRTAAAILLWWAVVVGVVFGGLPRGATATPALVAGLFLLGFGVLTALSIVWASDDGGAFVETTRVALYLGVFALVVLVSTPGSGRHWLGGLAGGLTGLAAIALASRYLPGIFGSQASETVPIAQVRLSYPVDYWNALAACMAIAAVLLLWLGADARTRTARAAAVAAVPIPVTVLYLTSSRGGFVALAVGLVVLVAAYPRRAPLIGGALVAWLGASVLIVATAASDDILDGRLETAAATRDGRALAAATLGLVLLVAVARYLADAALQRIEVSRNIRRLATAGVMLAAAGALLASDPAERIDAFTEPGLKPAAPGPGFVQDHLVSDTGGGRYQFWEVALDAFAGNPVAGIGAGAYETYWNRHQPLYYPIRDAHSLFLEAMAELGVLGLLLLLGFLVTPILAARRRHVEGSPGYTRAAALAVMASAIVSSAIDWTWELPAAFIPLVVAAAVLSGPASLEDPPPRLHVVRPTGSRYGWGLVTVLVAWLAIFVSALTLVTEQKLADSREQARSGSFARAVEDAEAAVAVQPWAAEPRLQKALAEEGLGDLLAARVAIAEAVSRAPDDWRLWVVAARLTINAGDIKNGRFALAKAKELHPRDPLFDRASAIHGPAPR